MQEIAVADAGAPVHRRVQSRSEWRADALVHVVGVTLGIAACIALALVALPDADLAVRVSLAVYGAGLLAMLGCSAVYNIRAHGPARNFWRRLDHAAIFVMIGGTYTPFAAIALGGAWGAGLLIFVWTVAAAGVVVKLLHPGRLETLSIATYLLLGWIILIAIDRLIAAVSPPALVLLVAGGILYSIGVLFHLWDRLPYNRAVWHGFVLIAAACHYVSVLDVVTG
ncbi:MAG TPA: hemolysin III family protein [Geminicoccaceae bacterium]